MLQTPPTATTATSQAITKDGETCLGNNVIVTFKSADYTRGGLRIFRAFGG